MYYYAILHENGSCHTILQVDEELDLESNPNHIKIDSRDESLLNQRRTDSGWEPQPSPHHFWDGSTWVDFTPANES